MIFPYPKLQGTANYKRWLRDVQRCLETEGLWGTLHASSRARDKYKDSEARIFFLSAVEDDLVPALHELTTAKQMMTYLAECFGEEGPVQHSINVGYLARLKFDNARESLESFTRKYVASIVACERSGYPISAEHKAYTLLGLIEQDFPKMVATKREEMRNGNIPPLYDLIPQLVYESKCKEFDDAAEGKEPVSADAEDNANRFGHEAEYRCLCCHDHGHRVQNCYHLHPDKSPNQDFKPDKRLVSRYNFRYGDPDAMEEAWQETLAHRKKRLENVWPAYGAGFRH